MASPEECVRACVCVSMVAVTACKHVFAKGKAMMKVLRRSRGRVVLFFSIIFFFLFPP